MKLSKILLLVMMVVVMIIVFIACNNDDEPEQYIYPITIVDEECKEFHIDSKAQQLEIGLRTNQDKWYLIIVDSDKTKDRNPVEATWVNYTTTRTDVVHKTIILQVEANDGEARKASVTIWSGGEPWSEGSTLSGRIEIYQAGVANP